jgi:hypothetical protein
MAMQLGLPQATASAGIIWIAGLAVGYTTNKGARMAAGAGEAGR